MAPPTDATVPSTRRTRKSIGAHTDLRKTMEKENATIDVASTLGASRKKSRSKSLGPGGLDALNRGTSSRRASLAAPSKAPRSILKPTIAPLAEIPPLKKKEKEPDLIDLGDPKKEDTTANSTSSETNGSKIALRTEEEQQAAARARDERDRRDARRKSLANRRVSFAAEATLHTFHEVEYMQDSTTSTDSTRRNSSLTGQSPHTGRESTPQGQVQGAPESPENQRDLHQRKRRRSSGLPPLNFNNPEDDTLTSTVYSSDSEPADAVEEEVAEIEDDGSGSDSDDGTMMSIVTEDITGTSVASDRSMDMTGDSSTLDEALRLAARRAGTQRLEEDQSDDGLDEGEEIIPSFGWANSKNKQKFAARDQEDLTLPSPSVHTEQREEDGTEMDMDMDMDMTRAVGGIIKPQASQATEPEEEMSMDVTRAFGGILPSTMHQKQEDDEDDEEDDTPMEEATMEFTTAIGGIHRQEVEEEDESEDNEDMSMELTTVMGGVLSQKTRKSLGPSRRRTINRKEKPGAEDATMDMTVGLGRIISGHQEEVNDDDPDGDVTMGMEMTTAIGGILGNANSRALGKRIMEEEVDAPDNPNQAILAAVNQPSTEVASEAKSPGLSAFRGKGLRRSAGPQLSTTPRSASKTKTPSPTKSSTTPKSTPKSTLTPLVELSTTPQSVLKKKSSAPVTPTTPQLEAKSSKKATPQSSARKLRSASASTRAKTVTPSPVKSAKRKSSIFQEDPKTGSRTPTVVLTPQARRLSGVGADRAGLGSPRVAALFDRRGSIGDAASQFVPGKRTVAFQDPQEMEDEVDKERQDDEDKENRRKILEREADGSQDDKDATLNLREMIDSMSPKRKPLKGRKSLHVGSARGVLGKRPSELDEDEEGEENDGVKRLKGHQSSPVKNIRLQQPPSKEETTGRLTRSFQTSLQPKLDSATPTLSSPRKGSPATTPKNQGRFKDVQDDPPTHSVNFDASPVKDAAQLEEEVDEERIHLQDFLNMTSIRFMELTTTKRRHTQAPGSFQDGSSAEEQDDMSLERCVVAGACTVPMLELYQHSCRELKKYISEGRRMVKEIETDTFEENPHLFREYMSATPEVKALMDNQFKNVKAHARLLSKAMWYEWRMKLQDGLKEGLMRIAEGMEKDEEYLKQQQDLLSSVMPAVLSRHELLDEESKNLEQVAQELADCDPSELQAARDELISVDQDVEQKKKLIADLRQQLQESETDVEALNERKQQCLEDIKEAEKIREECRGWTSTEVNSLKARVDAIEKEYGWAVTGISGTNLSLAYNREIELVLDIAAFKNHQPNSRIDLWYIADARERNPSPKTAEKEFFLQCIRDHVRALPQRRTKISDLLDMVQLAWDKASLVSSQIGRLNIAFPTAVTKTSDASVAMTSSLLLAPLETRVEATLHLQGESGPDGLEVLITPEAKVVYGEHFNVSKVGEFLQTRIGKKVGDGDEEWSDVIVELHERLIARGRKSAQAV